MTATAEQQVHVGWCNAEGEFQLVPPHQATFPTVEDAQRRVDQLNCIEHERAMLTAPGDEWFVMVGDAMCKIFCADCEGELHHWMFDANDETTAEEGEDIYPEGRMNCKHCDAWRTVIDSDE